jgi:hypothetical protein
MEKSKPWKGTGAVLERPKMTGWYDPPRLISIAIRVAISTVFGEFADRREAMAAARDIDPVRFDPAFDYREELSEEGFWLDFVADTGDGWNSTYAIARLLAERRLTIAGHDEQLPSGRVLIMGGDQVYPTASRDDYRLKLSAPYDEAAKIAGWPKGAEPHLYSIPGNHDWYDGLAAFIGLFCGRRLPGPWAQASEGRLVGGRRTRQTRSYFALALPRGWWLWGIDIQLAGYIDQPQVDFFAHVAACWMEPGSRLILCTGRPEWAYVDEKEPERTSFRNFSYLESLPSRAGRGHRLCLVLTGDSHHYARYTEGPVHYITAGGGGAFLHPTHQLTDKSFGWGYPPPGVAAGQKTYRRTFKIARDAATGRAALFPGADKSRRRTWRNLGFFYLNPQFTATLGLTCAFFAWLLHANAQIRGLTLAGALASPDVEGSWAALRAYGELVLVTPWPLALVAGAAGAYIYLADFKPWWRRAIAGLLHSVAQIGTVVVATILLAFYAPGAHASSALILYVGLCGGVLAATVMGAYLLLCLNWCGRHWNEAFSSLRMQDFKNFLRMRIDKNGTLTVYPIGLVKVPRDDATDPPHNPPLQPQLIETPIHLV